ncbi:MAG: PH domain-containing protein [Treponema sp.]|jgi:membrane protein YdbS with pleckstrin-like domain|nr:PH domain-containing protein [Treponema sp.]
MKFIKSKNLVEGEELLYVPVLHWIYLFRPILKIVFIYLVLFLLWFLANPTGILLNYMPGTVSGNYIGNIYKYMILIALIIALPVFICRIFQYVNTEFGVTNKRLIIKKGVLKIVVAEIPTDRIESIYSIQNFWDRIFGCGKIYISGIGGKVPVFFSVCHPFALRRKIVEIIEKNKTITVVHGDLPKPPPVEKPAPKEDPLYLFGTFVRVVS